jgi:hypothetical protein
LRSPRSLADPADAADYQEHLLAEVQATGGDPLMLTRLFGLSDPTAIRYCLQLGPLDQASPPQ